ncbi:MAG: phenylalanine--tRNA ligase subunit alpha [Cytophagales bacterium]|nr:phenylalanine--tRNA ligase subunit alpha [Cytophagales bacterium]
MADIDKIIAEIKSFKITSEKCLVIYKNKYKTLLDNLCKELKTAAVTEKKVLGQQINKLKTAIDERYKDGFNSLHRTISKTEEYYDYTLPVESTIGGLHPLTILKNKLNYIFQRLGFNLVDGPEVEDDWHNFTALNIPLYHPAREMQDTFFVDNDARNVLRTHTTSVQVRVLEHQPLPVRCITIGRVYRNETVSARANSVFHQFDGFCVDKNVSFADLKYVFTEIVKGLFGTSVSMRLRPSYFPFTSPSVETDISCTVCGGEGCTICKGSGWLEVWGGGMIHENVLRKCNIDNKEYSGFAFGGGIERLSMLLHRINDLRLYYNNDVRFLKQFKSFSL